MSRKEDEMPKCLFIRRYSIGTYNPMSGPVTYQGQNAARRSIFDLSKSSYVGLERY
jgi:hypothetical protein